MFKYRTKLGLAPLYILLGSVQYLQALSGSMVSFNIFDEYPIYPGSVIIFSAVLFAILLIYIKEGVASARTLIIGIIISNVILSALFGITYVQENATQIISLEDPSSIFQINYKYFITGTLILFIDFFLLVIIYQFLISKLNKLYFFLILFISLCSVLLFDALAFNILLKYGTPIFTSSLIGHIIGKSFSAVIFSLILYIYLKFIDKEEDNTGFIAAQNREIFSILTYRKKYFDLKEEKKEVEKKYISQIESTLNQISDGFVSLDRDWCYTYVNDKAGELLGRSPESLLGKYIWTEFPKGVDLPFYHAYYKAVKTQQTQYLIEYYEPFDKWFENRIYPSAEGLTIYFTDITEQKKADTNNQMLLSLIETSDDFVGLADLEGKPIYLNTNGRNLVGLDVNDDLSDSIANYFPDEYQDLILKKQLPEVFKQNKWKGETHLQNFKTGKFIPIEMSGFLIKESTTSKPMALGIVATDISERKKAEEKLINSEQLFRRLSSNAPVAIFQADKDGSCNYVNEEWIKYSGQTFNEALGFGWANSIHFEDKERVIKEWQESIITGNQFISDFRLLQKNGKIKWLSSKAVSLIDVNKVLYGYIGMLTDITERKNAEEQIIKSEKYLDSIINNIGDPVFVKDDQSHFLKANTAFYNLFNRTEKEILGKDFADDVPQEVRERYLRIDEQVMSTGIENIDEDSIQTKGKVKRFISTKKSRFIDGSGNKFLIGTIRDITTAKIAEEELIKSKIYLDNIINNIGDPVFVKDANSRLLIVNDAFCLLFNLSRAEVLGKTLAENVSEEERESFLSIDKQVISSGIENVNEETLTLTGQETKIVSTKKTRFVDSSNNIFLIGVIRDITDRKKAEIELEKHRNNLKELVELKTNELEKEKVKAQSADLMKSAFLATMSHELRTPMNSIIGFTGILLKELAGPLNDEQKRQLGMVKNSGQHLLGLINDVLDISKIEAGKLKVSLYHFNYLTTLEKTIDFLLPQATKKEIQILSEISELNITLNSDERRVEQVLLNLLSNAIKFSNHGTITVKVDIVDGLVVTQVIDQGIGMSKKDLNKLFMPFIQLDGGLSRTHEGTGLGLAICKSLIEKLGGTIQVQSKVDIGSNFTFTLPLEYVDKV
tara:strand:- start:48229 stop:51588 length:3360 start_codon:yes stop_codon:yes gene_type:complete